MRSPGDDALQDMPASLLGDDWEPGHRSGHVAVVGAPNVGKSTLMNAYLGQKIAIVSPKPQTTRHRILGILTRDDAQIILVDTPGLHKPIHALGEYMVDTAKGALSDADAILWLADTTRGPNQADRVVASILSELRAIPIALILNKMDLVDVETLGERQRLYQSLVPVDAVLPASAVSGKGLEEALAWVLERLPEGPRYYPEEQLTDREERFLAAELIREQALHHLRQEVPHAIAVSVDEFKERANGVVYIAATIYVEKDSQKGIVIGAGGATLKRVSTAARIEIERLLGKPVYLELWVKTRRNWRRNEAHLRQLGYRVRRKRK